MKENAHLACNTSISVSAPLGDGPRGVIGLLKAIRADLEGYLHAIKTGELHGGASGSPIVDDTAASHAQVLGPLGRAARAEPVPPSHGRGESLG